MSGTADPGGAETYESRTANALTWLVVEHLCECDLTFTKSAPGEANGDDIESRLLNALSLSPFRQQFDNFASQIELQNDDTQGLTFEIFEQNLCENLLGNLQRGDSDDLISAETLHAVLGSLRSSFTKSGPS